MRNLMLAGSVAATLALLPVTAVAQDVPVAVPAPVTAPADAAKPAAAEAAKPAAVQKTAEQQAIEDRENEWICKRQKVIGSLVKTTKTCHTRKQWAYINSENQRIGQDMVLQNQGKPGSN